MGIPLNQPFSADFPKKKAIFGVLPFMESPICLSLPVKAWGLSTFVSGLGAAADRRR